MIHAQPRLPKAAGVPAIARFYVYILTVIL
jgi:hypothetical protein